MDLSVVRTVALAAAAQASGLLKESWGKTHDVREKSAKNLVTEADVASERAIIEIIKGSFADHSIIAEEGGEQPGSSSFQWIVDPLDGTTNFAHGLPQFCVSIAFAIDGVVQVGVVSGPITGELFCAVRNNGATLNGRPIAVSSVNTLRESLLVTGVPYNLKPVLREVMARFESCLLRAQAVRRLGSAAMDLCYVACGRFDGFWEQNLAPWDTAAGVLIAAEAGARVSGFSGDTFLLEKKEILVSNGLIHEELLDALIVS